MSVSKIKQGIVGISGTSTQIVRPCLKRMQIPKLVHVVTSSVQLPPEENRKRRCRTRARRAIAAAVEERAPSSPPTYDAHSAAKPPYPQPRRVMRPALTTALPQKHAARILFLFPTWLLHKRSVRAF
jgi:hypothetical protein